MDVRDTPSAIVTPGGISVTLPICAKLGVRNSAPIYHNMPRGAEMPPKQLTVFIRVAGGQLGRPIK